MNQVSVLVTVFGTTWFISCGQQGSNKRGVPRAMPIADDSTSTVGRALLVRRKGKEFFGSLCVF